MRLRTTFRATMTIALCVGLVGMQQTSASADPVTCTLNQVASDPTNRDFSNAEELQSQLDTAAGDDGCSDVVVQFTTGVTLAGQELGWAGAQPLQLVGQGRTETTIDADDQSRVVHVTSGDVPDLTVRDLTITGGVADDSGGGGILTDGDLVVEDSGILSNTSPMVGGGIKALGSVSITSSVVSGNSVTRDSTSEAAGGGIYVATTLTATDSQFSNNTARNSGSGDAIGGGISVGQTLTLSSSQVTGNSAVADDGSAVALGGGVAAQFGDITDSTFSTNTTNAGWIAEGSAFQLADTSSVENTTVTGNVGQGTETKGSVASGGGTLTITNSTITGNSSYAMSNSRPGVVSTIGLVVKFSTIVGNSVGSGTSAGSEINGGNQQVTLKGSVVANENGGACAQLTLNPASEYNGTTTGDTTCGIQSSQDPVTGTWAELGLNQLNNNGGPTQTMALSADSILNAAIPNAAASAILGVGGTDQRGVIRSDGGSPGNSFAIGAEQNATVTFDPNGGSGAMSPQSSTEAAALTANTFTRSGYQFDGWKTAPDSGTAYEDEAEYPFDARTPDVANATLYAQWTQTSAPTITSADAATATQGSAMNPFTVTTTATPTVTSITESPTGQQTGLPNGISLTYVSGSSATLAGTPSQSGTFTTTITADNGVDPAATQPFTLTVASGSNSQGLVPPGCVNSSAPNGRSSVVLTRGTCRTTAGQAVGTKVTVKINRGDVRGYQLRCLVNKKLRPPRSLARYGSGYKYCQRGSLILIGNGEAAQARVTWYAPAKNAYEAFKRVRTIRMT